MTTKGMDALFKELKAQGFEVKEATKGWKIFPPDPTHSIVVVHKTPSDHRAWANMMALLKRSGFVVRKK